MKIKSIKIKGWRSFNDTEGIELNNLKKINLIIGPNNSGKSNLLKFFDAFGRICSPHIQESSGIGSMLHCTSDAGGQQLLRREDFWNPSNAEIDAEIIFEVGSQELQVSNDTISLPPALQDSFALQLHCTPEIKARGQERRWVTRLMPNIIVHSSRLLEIAEQQIFKEAKHKILYSGIQALKHAEFRSLEYRELLLKIQSVLPGSDIQELVPLQKYHPTKNDYVALSSFSETSAYKPGYDPGATNGMFERVIVPLTNISFGSMFLISPIRDHQGSSTAKIRGVNGSEIVNQCVALLNDFNQGPERLKFRKDISNWMSTILGEPIESIAAVGKDLVFYLNRSANELEQTFDNLGTGVSQIFIVLVYLYFKQETYANVFLDEPENSLHARALTTLVDILQTEKEFSNHQFFITTHAPSLMDMVTDDWTVHRVSMSSEKGTQIQPCLDIVSRHAMLDEMGIRASQILQSNLAIWVEGPSDRQYIRAWIRIVSDGKLKEGKHFSFAFYGGSVLNHYGFEDPSEEAIEQCISLFSTSRYSYIVMDSDKSEGSASDKPIYTKLKAHLDVDPAKKDYIKIWQTAGREIENYVPEQLWEAMASEDSLWRKIVKVGGAQSQLLRKRHNQSEFERYTNFAEFLSSWYCTDNGDDLGADRKEFVKFHDSKKVEIAKFMAEKWSSVAGDQWPLDLHSQVSELVKQIKIANGI